MFILYQAHCVLWTHHVVRQDRQEHFEFVRVDIKAGLDSTPWPDGPALKHLKTKFGFEIR